VVDGLANGPELGCGQHLALHQAAGGLVLVGQAALDGRPVVGVHRRQHLGALLALQVVDDVGRVVGVELFQGAGQGRRMNRVEDLLAQVVVQFGQHLGEGLRIETGNDLLAVVRVEEAHQVGHVLRPQGADQLTQPLGVAAVGGVDDHVDVFGIEGVVVAQREVFEVLGRGGGFGAGGNRQGLFLDQVGFIPGHVGAS